MRTHTNTHTHSQTHVYLSSRLRSMSGGSQERERASGKTETPHLVYDLILIKHDVMFSFFFHSFSLSSAPRSVPAISKIRTGENTHTNTRTQTHAHGITHTYRDPPLQRVCAPGVRCVPQTPPSAEVISECDGIRLSLKRSVYKGRSFACVL